MDTGRRAYISGPLTIVRDRHAARLYYERLAQICRREGLTPYLPHTENDPELHADESAAKVFERDMNQLLSARIVVAYIGSPSLGVGAELAFASENKIPIVAIRRPGESVSRFALGMLSASGAYDLITPDERLDDELSHALRVTIARLANDLDRRSSLWLGY